MNKKLLILTLGLAILAASCSKDNTKKDPVITNPTKLTDLVIPAGFTWQSARDVNFSISITDTRFQNKIHVVAIYLADPVTKPIAIAKGSATLTNPFIATLSIPSTVNEAYVVKTSPDGSSVTEKLSLTSTKVSAALSSVNKDNKLSFFMAGKSLMGTEVEPECGTKTSASNIKLNTSTDVYCFTSTVDLTINVEANNGGTLKINAPGKTITFGDNFNHTGIKVFISEGTTVRFNRDLNIKSGEIFSNSGKLLAGNLSSAGIFVNNGEATFSGSNFNLNSGSELTNRSTMAVQSQNPSINGLITNSGNMTFNNATFNSGSTLNNYCSFTVNNVLTVNTGALNNYKLVLVKGDTYVNSGGTINLIDGAMHQTLNMSNMNGVVYGRGPAVSLFKTTGTVGDNVVNNSGYFKGALQYCGTRDLEVNQNNKKHFSDGAIKGCGAYIIKDDCNTLGNGVPPVQIKPDTDGDGIIDEQDDYPNDKTKAFDNFSVNYHKGGSTIAFEDSWPVLGDYDLNDVVLTYKHLVVTNAKNVAVRIEGKWNLIASGASYKNGAAVQFPLPKNMATNFKSSDGVSREDGHDSLVVILFNNARDQQVLWNTMPNQSLSPVKTFTFSFDLTDGPSFPALGVSAFNPFLFNGTKDAIRGYETHLFGKHPTKLADKSLFGTNADNSLKGVYYSTKGRLPWGIEIPVATFRYPYEKIGILESYLKFSSWATSGGSLYADWYSNTATDFRDATKLFPSVAPAN
ncbi:LruC domain-containing protein [Pedobacter panaciterrae]